MSKRRTYIMSQGYFMQFDGEQCATKVSEYGSTAWQALATYLRREGEKRLCDPYHDDTALIAFANDDGYLNKEAFNGLHTLYQKIITSDKKRFQGTMYEPIRQMRFYVIKRNVPYDEASGWMYEPNWHDKKPFIVSRKLPIDKTKIDNWSFEIAYEEMKDEQRKR